MSGHADAQSSRKIAEEEIPMGDYSGDSVSIDMDTVGYGGKEHLVETRHGFVSVTVIGDHDKPGLITYTDIGSNHVSCFERLFECDGGRTLLLHNFCIYHISPPGHECGAYEISSNESLHSVGDLADQIAEVLDFFRLDAVMCLGVTAGAYILTQFAIRYRLRVIGLILVSPICKAPSWTEWMYNKVLSNLLYFYGTCSVVRELLMKRYFSKDVGESFQIQETEIFQPLEVSCSPNLWQYIEAMNRRRDISDGLKRIQCRSLIIVGENSIFHSDAVHMISKLDRRRSALVEVQGCGSMVTVEQPEAMLIPVEHFLTGFGLYRSCVPSFSPRSPLSPTCISPELLSPESMGVKLKPIKTRSPISLQAS